MLLVSFGPRSLADPSQSNLVDRTSILKKLSEPHLSEELGISIAPFMRIDSEAICVGYAEPRSRSDAILTTVQSCN